MLSALLLLAVESEVPSELREALAVLNDQQALLEYDIEYEEARSSSYVRNRFDGPRFQFAWAPPEPKDLPLPALKRHEIVVTQLDEGCFHGDGYAVSADWHDRYEHDQVQQDLRNLGLSSFRGGLQLPFRKPGAKSGESICNGDAEFEVADSPGGFVVTADCGGGFRQEWVIRDGSPKLIERITSWRSEEMLGRAELEWTQRDGVPVPESIQYLKNQDGRLMPDSHYTLRRAQFAGLGKMTPEDADIDVGTNIDRYVNGEEEMWPGTGFPKTYTWDGENFITFQEMMRRKDAGELQLGSRFRRDGALGVLQLRISAGNAETGNWRSLVRMFVKAHQLDDEQSQKAWSIYEDCVTQYRAVCDQQARSGSAAADVRQIAQEIAELAETTPLGIRALADERMAAVKRFAVFGEAARAIFKDRLIPRLQKLPTRDQVRRADDTGFKAHLAALLPEPPARPGAATQPASQP